MPKDIRRLLLFLLAVGLPCGGFVLWRRLDDRAAERKWAEYVAAARSRGVKLTVEEFFVDPRLAESENFAASPLWDRAFAAGAGSGTVIPELPKAKATDADKGGRIDLPDLRFRMVQAKWLTPEQSNLGNAEAILAGLQRFRLEFDELRSLRHRARAWFPVNWHKAYSAEYPHFPVIKNLHAILAMKARAEIELGRANDACETLQDAFQLASSLDAAPNLISVLLSSAIDSSIVREVHEGIARGTWTTEQLQVFQKLFASRDALARMKAALEGERALFNTMIDPVAAEMIGRLYVPKSEATPLGLPDWAATGRARWWRGNQQWVNQSFDEEIAALDLQAGTWRPLANRSFDVEQVEPDSNLQLVRIVLPPFITWRRQGLLAHVTNCMGQIACALERFRRAQGQYPPDLRALQPTFLAQFPPDPITGNAFQYRRDDNGYILYSVAINGVDDGGTGNVFMDRPDDRTRLPDWAWHGPSGAPKSP